MTGRPTYDAVVVGAGPNGLSAAVELARNGCSVAVVEAESTIGGGARSAELTLPEYVHDLGSAIHPFGYASRFSARSPSKTMGWSGYTLTRPSPTLSTTGRRRCWSVRRRIPGQPSDRTPKRTAI
jgi:phytoene dehydrogenase-like protein